MGNIVTDPEKMGVIEGRIRTLTYVLETAVVAHLAEVPDNGYTFEELAQAHAECAVAALRTGFKMECKIEDEEPE